MRYIYVLALNNNKYYIGKTSNPNFRIEQHFNFNGSNWTKKYKQIKILEIIPNCDNFDEDKYTLKYMKNFGIDNVRGGSFCEITLDESNIYTIQKMITGSSNKCYICNEIGHFANECNNKNMIGRKVKYSDNFNYPLKKFRRNIFCYKCNQEGHYRSECIN